MAASNTSFPTGSAPTSSAPTIIAPTWNDPMPINVLERTFLRSHTTFPESHAYVFDRWFFIVENFPAMRNHRLYDDLTPIFLTAYRTATGIKLMAAVELALLRWRFYEFLLSQGIGRAHINRRESEASCVWRDKLLDRAGHTKPAKITGTDRYLPAKLPAVTHHRWAH